MKASMWITWKPEPVVIDAHDGESFIVPAIDPNCMIDVLWRDGSFHKAIAKRVDWHTLSGNGYRDIVAYRIVWER